MFPSAHTQEQRVQTLPSYSTATTWALFALTQNMEVQRKLRNELLAFPSDRPTMDDLNSFPYLDFVVRETLRLHTPVPMTSRIAMKDDIVPLKTPFVDKKGVTQHSIRSVNSFDTFCDDVIPTDISCRRINKGQEMVIPILALNRSKSLWGEDAMEFKYVHNSIDMIYYACSVNIILFFVDQNDGNRYQKLSQPSQVSGALSLRSLEGERSESYICPATFSLLIL